MTFTLNLPPKLEQYLAQQAQQQGISLETYTLQILREYILTN
jgi:predicted HicB family RNase H-like nuclease